MISLVLLLASGTAGALALLPPDVVGGAAQRLGFAAEGVAPSFIAEGDLGDRTPRRTAPVPTTTARSRDGMWRHRRRKALSRSTGRPRATFGVSWRLIASIHRQETAFSSVPSTYHGLNAFGCCAGPMQFNVTNGPPSTWARYRKSFRRGKRPRRYPHRTRHHPSIYDDFDAIMAAGALLRDAAPGARSTSARGRRPTTTTATTCFGTHYASQVLGRAPGWERYGFCLNCALDGSLVAEFDESYGEQARRQLRAAERDKKDKAKHKKKRKQKRDRDKAKREHRAPAPSADAEPTPLPSEPTPRPAPSTTTTTTPTTTQTAPQPATAPPPAKTCTKLERLLGCRDA